MVVLLASAENPSDSVEFARVYGDEKLRELGEEVYAVERLMAKRTRRGRPQFLVRWQGFGPEHDTWEDERNILDDDLVAAYEEESALQRAALKGEIGRAHV